MQNIKLSLLNEIPFFDLTQVNGRFIPTLSFYDSSEWHMWLALNDKLIKYKGYPSEGIYFSKDPERNDDLFFVFLDFLFQRASINEIEKPVNGILDDIYNISASLNKFSILYDYSKKNKDSMARMVLTEIEYIFGVCRSIFDLLQEIISLLWNNVKFFDENIKKKELPKSFRKMVIEDEKVMDLNQITSKYKIPEHLANFYNRFSEFFQILKKYRDNIEHHGSSFEYIFTTERGFAVKDTMKPFCDFNIWNDNHKLPNGLSSLRPAIAYIIYQTIIACEDYAKTINKIIKFHSPIAPGYKIFLRGFSNSEILKIKDIITNCLWWDE